ncbi:RNA polymerase sigma factor [Pinibacter soli]|uniref:RNA polymerase sigma-70 factor n=1 Tax=Pinibacter soli TaxID=3044211 RepID=A0ABT6RHD8_9BACT|nr:RNA polymerase sigma-70 factor [Pinibacter soli]MDI3321886.1 RNA polymerase sigma-70 factor [Pinibacter soli]
MTASEDREILELLKQGEAAGFKALFDKYYKQLCMQATLLLPDEADAEDLVQDVFVKFWHERKFDAINESLGSYLGVSIRNAALNILKVKSRYTEKEKGYTNLLSSSVQVNHMELAEITTAINDALNELPQQCRQIFELVYVDGKKYQEAADTFDVSINTVKTQLKRAFTKLRTSLKNYSSFVGILSPVFIYLLSNK